jgi:tetratricopeptide (TPR) repeat protein
LLATALHSKAAQPRQKLKQAETENARNELKNAMRELLDQALAEYVTLQEQLMKSEEVDKLDELGQRVLRDCHFQRAHTLYALEEYETAIQAYNSAANRYPEDPEVLLAYVQMTNCNNALGRTADARSTAVQAALILKQMPEGSFTPSLTNMTKQEWELWLSRANQMNRRL